MPRYKLRTLVFLTAVGPPVLAVAWFGCRYIGIVLGSPALTVAVVAFALYTVLTLLMLGIINVPLPRR